MEIQNMILNTHDWLPNMRLLMISVQKQLKTYPFTTVEKKTGQSFMPLINMRNIFFRFMKTKL